MAVTVEMLETMAADALVVLENQLVHADVVYRGYEKDIGVKGDTIKVRKPPTLQAHEFTGTITKQNVTESHVNMKLEHDWHVAYALPDFERTVQDRDLLKQWNQSAIAPLAQKINMTIAEAITYGVIDSADILGATNASIGYPQLVAARRRRMKKQIPDDTPNLYFIVGPDDDANLLNDEKVINRDYTGNGGEAVKNAYIGQRAGWNILGTQNICAPAPGDTSGAVNNGAGYSTGATAITMDAVTVAPPIGTLFTFVGHTTKYRVQAGTSTTALVFAPALTAGIADNEIITFLDVNQNIAFHKNAAALAMRPKELPPVPGKLATYVTYKGLAIRIVVDWDIDTESTIVLYDALWATEMIDPRLAMVYLSQKIPG